MNYAVERPCAVCDTECFPNYWSIGFKSITDGRKRVFELYPGHPLDRQSIGTIFRKWRIYTFNGVAYDIPMILLAMRGATNEELKQANDEIIKYGVPWWKFMERHELVKPEFLDHIDLMNVSPGSPQNNGRSKGGPSLKIYGGRLHSRKMQEMPVHFEETLTDLTRNVVRSYHDNDLDTTIDLANELKAQVQLRALMSDEYGVDVRSKSDAQVAEAVVKVEIQKALGRRVYAPDIEVGSFQYKMPAWAKFETPEMRRVVQIIREARFEVGHSGVVEVPDGLHALVVEIGGTPYNMGIGGLHSKESRVSHFTDDDHVLLDRDVTSYYPMSILLQKMFPKHLGSAFLNIYRKIYERRIAAKKAGDKNTAETLKIVLNGVFGKLGDVFSIFYSPDLMIQVTLSGQLAVLMLIERLEAAGITVVSANTDGIVSKVPRHLKTRFNDVILDWELDTEYATEETEYISTHSRDVNAYFAFKKGKDGKIEVKRKGAYAESGPGLPGASGLKKNPNMDVSVDAVIEFLKNGTPIEETIEWCTDIRKFIVVRRVNGGAKDQDGVEIGKALRWYYSRNVRGAFTHGDNDARVPETEGAKLLMELDKPFPSDIDYDRYVREAYAILEEVGMPVEDPDLRGRSGYVYGKLDDPKVKGLHVVNLQSGVAICGKRRESIREKWIEFKTAPDGMRVCPKCKKAT